jgi:NitT/TauT family transport system substrate-binding protein
MRAIKKFAVAALAVACAGLAQAQETKVSIAISGWTGFAPLVLAKEAGIFKKNGLDVTIRKIPQKDRHLALASGDVQCAATSTETWIVWNTNGIDTKQVFKMDQGMGADGIVARNHIKSVADLKGKTIAVSAPGTNPHFTLSWILKQNGLSLNDVKLVTLEPSAAANAFVSGSGNLDAAVTYEPYLSLVHDKPEAGRLIADSLQYPIVFDTFGCMTKFVEENPKAVKAITESYFEALDMIKNDRVKAFTIMGADREANIRFFNGEIQAFNKAAAELLREIGVLRKEPGDLNQIFDTRFIAK